MLPRVASSARHLRTAFGVSVALGVLGARPVRAEVPQGPAPVPSVSVAADPVPSETPPQGEGDPASRKSAEDAGAEDVLGRAAEEKRLRSEAAVAYARRRVRQMAERKARAEARAAARAEAARRVVPPAAVSAPAAARPPAELPTIVDHRTALERQLAAGWGWGADKDRQVRVPLPDWQNWRRVNLLGVDHLAAFTYTKEHHALTAVFAVETRAQKPSSLSCMEEFERRGMPEIRRHGVQLTPIAASASSWQERPVLVHKTEGRVSILFSRYEFSAAWTAYPAYDHGCLVYATVVVWDGQPELARKLLDRFVVEGVGQVYPLTPVLPARPEDEPGSVRASKLASAGKQRSL